MSSLLTVSQRLPPASIPAQWDCPDVRQLGGPGRARDSTSPDSVTLLLSTEAVVLVTSGKHEDKPAVVNVGQTRGQASSSHWVSWSRPRMRGLRLGLIIWRWWSLSHSFVQPSALVNTADLEQPPPPLLGQQSTDNTTSQLATRYPVAPSLWRGPLLCPISPCGLLFAAPCWGRLLDQPGRRQRLGWCVACTTVLPGEQAGHGDCPPLPRAKTLVRCAPWLRLTVPSYRPDDMTKRNSRPSDRLLLLSWNPWPIRGSDPSLLASHLNGPWHVVCVQEDSGFCNDMTL